MKYQQDPESTTSALNSPTLCHLQGKLSPGWKSRWGPSGASLDLFPEWASGSLVHPVAPVSSDSGDIPCLVIGHLCHSLCCGLNACVPFQNAHRDVIDHEVVSRSRGGGWGHSSVGRVFAWHAQGPGFHPQHRENQTKPKQNKKWGLSGAEP